MLLLVGAALLVKGAAAMLVLKPAVWETWLKPGVSIGMTAGLLVLFFVVFLPRPVQVATCAIALLASLLLPVVAVDLPPARAPLTLFNWRYGHLLTSTASRNRCCSCGRSSPRRGCSCSPGVRAGASPD